MTREFLQIAINNVLRIKNAEGESLQKSDFLYDVVNDIGLQKMLDFLVENDYIETEEEPDRYYLVPETYDLIENDLLADSIYSHGKQEEWVNEEQLLKHDELNDGSISNNDDLLRGVKLSGPRAYLFVMVVAILTIIGLSVRYDKRRLDKPNEIHIDSTHINKLHQSVQRQIDSIKSVRDSINQTQ